MKRVFLFLSMLMAVSGCFKDESISGYDGGGIWHLIELDDAPYQGRATVTFGSNGRVSGQSTCREFTARQTVPLPWIQIEQITPSGSPCPDTSAEQIYFTALGAMTFAEVSGPTLLLQNDAGREMLFTASPPDG